MIKLKIVVKENIIYSVLKLKYACRINRFALYRTVTSMGYKELQKLFMSIIFKIEYKKD